MFIILEGHEGSGKTSQIPPLVEYLRGKGYIVFATCEPGGMSIGEQIHDVYHIILTLSDLERSSATDTPILYF